MKRPSLGVLSITCLALLASGQGVKREIPVSFRAATQVVTGSVIHLKGAIQITTDQHVIHADEADFDVATGDIQAQGNVRAFKIGLATYATARKLEWIRTNIDGKKAVMTVKPSPPSAATPR